MVAIILLQCAAFLYHLAIRLAILQAALISPNKFQGQVAVASTNQFLTLLTASCVFLSTCLVSLNNRGSVYPSVYRHLIVTLKSGMRLA
jgi:hypothetical protein